MADLVGRVGLTPGGPYAAAPGTNPAEVRAFMDAETWFDAAEALERGVVNRVEGERPAKAKALRTGRNLDHPS